MMIFYEKPPEREPKDGEEWHFDRFSWWPVKHVNVISTDKTVEDRKATIWLTHYKEVAIYHKLGAGHYEWEIVRKYLIIS